MKNERLLQTAHNQYTHRPNKYIMDIGQLVVVFDCVRAYLCAITERVCGLVDVRSQIKMFNKVMKQKKKHPTNERLPTYTLTNILDGEN